MNIKDVSTACYVFKALHTAYSYDFGYMESNQERLNLGIHSPDLQRIRRYRNITPDRAVEILQSGPPEGL
jgi:hypothetical protein